MILISERYRKLNQMLHSAPRGFGASGHRWASEVALITDLFQVKSWLDYGCGQSTLMKKFKKKYDRRFISIRYREYDPCVSGKNIFPDKKFDLITCTDVMEHVEPHYLSDVIKHIYSNATKVIFFNINTQEANKELPDGRNAHLTIEGQDWWIAKIKEHTDWTVSKKTVSRPWKDLNLWSYPRSL